MKYALGEKCRFILINGAVQEQDKE